MSTRTSLLVSLFALTIWAQTPDKVFYFAHLETPQSMQEFTNAVRSIGDIRDVSLDVTKRSLTVKGTADQIALAGWFTAELDNSGAQGTRDLPTNDPKNSLAQIYFLKNVNDPRDLQEIVNAARSVVDIQRFFPMNHQRAIVMRGSPAQVKAADWVLGVLDQPVGSQPAGIPQDYHLSASDWDARSGLVVQVIPLAHLDTPQGIQELVNVTRSVADIQRFFPVNARRMLVIRGSEDQIVLADWLVKELDAPSGQQGTKEFKAGNRIAQVAYTNAATPQSLQETINQIRQETKIPRVFPFHLHKAVAMVGTPDQVSLAQQVIHSRQGK
jgi:hypothetical protein